MKIFKKTGAVLEDLSIELNDYYSSASSIAITAATDKIYIGSRFPFNTQYFKVATAPTPASDITFKYLTGDGFKVPSDLEDGTKGLTQSGNLRFTPNRDFGILREDTANIEELNTIDIYGRFWYEISFSVDTVVELSWLGNMFSNDSHLASKYPDLNRNNVRTIFEVGKTDWEEQSMLAAEFIAKDLINLQNVMDVAQLLEVSELRLASIEKTAQIIYGALGQDFDEQEQRAKARYEVLISQPPRFIDADGNARVTKSEFSPSIGNLKR